MDQINKKYPGRITLSFVKELNDSLSEYALVDIYLNFIPHTGISSAAWQQAALSGVLSRFEHKTTSGLVQVYDWTNKDLVFSDADCFSKIILHDDDGKEISNPSAIEKIYKRLAIIYSGKLGFMEAAYRKINWEVR